MASQTAKRCRQNRSPQRENRLGGWGECAGTRGSFEPWFTVPAGVGHPQHLMKGMALTIVENTRARTLVITAGIDTHADFHVAAAIDHNGGVLGIETFDTTAC
jgi:hypothetical protein